MNILFVSRELIAGDVAYSLTKIGHSVKLHIDGEHCRHNLHDMVVKTSDWRKELRWVGKEGLIVFDDTGYGKVQAKLRREGYKVFGGGPVGDLLSHNHVFSLDTFAEYGLKVMPLRKFATAEAALRFVRKHRSAWVLRGDAEMGYGGHYVGMLDDGRDILDVLADLKKSQTKGPFTLQAKVLGEEISVSALFNGKDWVGPPLLHVEHRQLMAGEVGPVAGDMGSIGWYEQSSERDGLFSRTLGKLKPYLQSVDYRGAISLSCIVNEKGAYPVNVVCRASSPVLHLQSELNITPWAELLLAVASGQQCELAYKPGTAIAVVIAVPPYPLKRRGLKLPPSAARIYFSKDSSAQVQEHVHFEDVSYDKKNRNYYVSEAGGHALYVTESGLTVEEARSKAYRIVKKIVIPQMIYRDDIGERFAEKTRKQLRKSGYIY